MKQNGLFLIVLALVTGCRDPRSVDTSVAFQFTKALTARDYAKAYAMTAREYQDRISLDQMRKSFEAIVPKDWIVRGPAPYSDVTVGQTMIDWPDKRPQDVAWAYVLIPGDVASEGLVAILTREGNAVKVRDVVWGRP